MCSIKRHGGDLLGEKASGRTTQDELLLFKRACAVPRCADGDVGPCRDKGPGDVPNLLTDIAEERDLGNGTAESGPSCLFEMILY